eukprot:644101_1
MATIPCPDRVVDDCGGAFAMGAIGASIWHGVKGYRNTPKGGKFSGCVQAIRQRAPVTGGAFALWGLSFSTFDCAIAKYRKKEDPWNAIMAGAATGGLLAARSGYKAVLMQAAFGGIFLAMIEGMGIAIGNSMSKKEEEEERAQSPYMFQSPSPPPAIPGQPQSIEMGDHTVPFSEDSLAGITDHYQLNSSTSLGGGSGFDFADFSEDDFDDAGIECLRIMKMWT